MLTYINKNVINKFDNNKYKNNFSIRTYCY